MKHSSHLSARAAFWHLTCLIAFTTLVALWIYTAAPPNVR